MNLKLRFKNPTFAINLVIGAAMIVLSYFNFTPQDLTTWQRTGELFMSFIQNPFLIFSVIWYIYMSFMDPTTPGTGDSDVSLAKANVRDTAEDVIRKMQMVEEKEKLTKLK